MPRLLRYDWPGNVRELENALEFAVAVCQGQTIHVHDLPPEIVEPAPGPDAAPPAGSAPPAAAPDEPKDERSRLAEALDAHQWRRDETAKALGMSRTTLWRKMREHGLIR